jgi:hypothetical protein
MPLRGVAIGSVLVLMALGLGPLGLSGCSSATSGTGPIPTSGMSGGAAGASSAAGSDNGAGGSSGSGSTTGTDTSGATTGTDTSGATTGTGTSGASTGTDTSGASTGSSTSGAQGASGVTGSSSGTGTSDGGRPSGPSAGCNAATTSADTGQAMEKDITVNVAAQYMAAYSSRKYYVNLPMNWDPTKVYPMVFYGQGCGQTGPEGGPYTTGHFLTDIIYIQLIPATVTEATVVPSDGSPGCFQAGKQGLADSPDGPYFDLVLSQVESTFCVDTGKVYVAGSSSGAWLTNYLACTRGNVIRGAAADSGGLQHDHGTCTGGAAVMEMPGDSASSIVGGFDIGVAPARDTFIATDSCSMTPTNMTFGAANCQFYAGCSAPVAYCNVGGGHQSGIPFIADASWAFWNSLP